MKKLTLIVLLIAAIAMISTPASAFDLNGYLGEIKLDVVGPTYHDTKGTADTADDETWVVFQVNRFSHGIATDEWVNGEGGEHIYGIVYGLTDVSVTTDPVTGDLTILQTGGNFEMFLYNSAITNLDTVGANSASALANLQAGSSTINPFLTGVFTPNVIAAGVTLQQNIYATPGTVDGSGFGYADVTGGDYKAWFDSNSQAGGSDLALGFDLTECGENDNCDFILHDPIIGNVVPEPTSMLLLGSGLIGLLGFRRKK